MEQAFFYIGVLTALFIVGVFIGLLFMAIKDRGTALRALLRGQEQQLRVNQNIMTTLASLQRQIDRMQHSENEQATIFERRLSNQAVGFNERLEKLEQKPARRTKTR